MRIGQQERSYRLRTMPMRDAEGRLLGAVTTLEDVTSLQDIDRFKTKFIAVASRKLRDERWRHKFGRTGHDDAVKRRGFRPAGGAITQP